VSILLTAFSGVLLGLVLWSPSEYALHRFAMHTTPSRGPIAGEHRRHHASPEATVLHLRILLHLGVYLGAALVGLALAQVLAPTLAAGLAVGYAAGFAAYETLHWRSHHREPRWRYTIWLRQHHLEHHRHARTAYGVTSATWDRVFGTTGVE
jgi:sterol desaturase/sphingolipid hydroxylase (fatty acid hydroxylase superfamily)